MSTVLEPIESLVDPSDVRLQPPVDWAPSATTTRNTGLYALMAVSVAASVWYLTWLLQPERVGNAYLYGLLVAAELFNIAQAMGFWWTVTARRRRTHAVELLPLATDTEVDVFIPTYSEPVDVVEATVARAAQMTGARVNVWLLDDGDRPEMLTLASRYGIGYITRDEHEGAKAGNINHALGVTSAPYVAVLDCDHVPLSHFLEATLAHFRDERVAFVQTPQYYANFEKNAIAAASWSQQAIFFGAICQGKDRHESTFCCGTNVVFRRTALESAGGFPTNSLTEDFELSLRLHETGWKSRYVSETLASGLGPEDMASYVSQQHRWARGCLSALPRIIKTRLPMRQRVQYLLSGLHFLSGFTALIYMSLPVMNLLFGVQPLASLTADRFLLQFAPYYGLCLYVLARAGGGTYTFGAFALASANFWIHIHACYRWIFRRPSRFVVTPKQGSATRQPRAVAVPLVVIAVLLMAIAVGLARGVTPATVNNVAFALLHVTVLSVGIWPALAGTRSEQEDVVDVRDPHPHVRLLRQDATA